MAVFDVSSEDFESAVVERSACKPVVVVFWAPWCGPCKVLKPMLERLAGEYEFDIARVDITANPDLAERHMVRGVPTALVVSAGKESLRHVGMAPEPQIKKKLTDVGVIFD